PDSRLCPPRRSSDLSRALGRALRLLEAYDAVLILATRQFSFVVQRMKVSDGLAHGEGKLMRIEFALEQDRDHIRGTFGLAAGRPYFSQALGMMRMLLVDAFV